MSWSFGSTVVLRSRSSATRDKYGNKVLDTSVETTFTNVPVWPTDGNGNSSNEQTYQHQLVTSGLSALLPTGTEVLPTDQMVIDGKLYEVAGQPAIFKSPFTGNSPGVLIQLSRVSG